MLRVYFVFVFVFVFARISRAITVSPLQCHKYNLCLYSYSYSHVARAHAPRPRRVRPPRRYARAFLPARVFPRLDRPAEFWRERAFADGDWESMARRFLADAWSEELLTPLEDADRAVRLQIEHIDVGAYLSMLTVGAPR